MFATLFDAAIGCAVHSTLPAGVGYTMLELKVNFIRPLKVDTSLVRCVGMVLAAGRQVVTAEGRLIDEAGKLYAHATTTCLLLPPRP